MHPASLLSFYPTYSILDQICSYGNYKNINIFIDLKNNLQSTYMEHVIINIIENTKMSNRVDTSIFTSLISFLTFHKIYGLKRGINLNFIIFFESGHSYYHKHISKDYKKSRTLDDLYGLDKDSRDLYFKVLHANFQLIESACNKMPNIKVIRLQNLEADFIPYYVITRNLVKTGNETVNVIYSTDHDMWQCINNDVYVYSKLKQNKKIRSKGNVMETFLKRPCNIKDEYLPLAMAVIGDPGDDVAGIKSIGPASFIDIFDQLLSLTGNLEQIYNKVENNKPLFDYEPESFVNKKLKLIFDAEKEHRTISNNLKLVSFELISRAVESPSTTEMMDRRKIIENHFSQSKNIADKNSMKIALDKSGVYLDENSIDYLYV